MLRYHGRMKAGTLGNRPWYIYSLNDGLTGEIRYVGWSVDLVHRLMMHLADAKANPSKTHKTKWIMSQLKKDTKPTIHIIEKGIGEGWREREVYWIAHYREQGVNLVNATAGGEGTPGHTHSPETRALLSRIHTGKKQSQEQIRKFIASRTGVLHSQETKDKISKALMGRKPSEETRQKMIAALTGRVSSEETRAKISASKLGKPRSEETCAKMSAAKMGVPRSRESVEKMMATKRRQKEEAERDQLTLFPKPIP